MGSHWRVESKEDDSALSIQKDHSEGLVWSMDCREWVGLEDQFASFSHLSKDERDIQTA